MPTIPPAPTGRSRHIFRPAQNTFQDGAEDRQDKQRGGSDFVVVCLVFRLFCVQTKIFIQHDAGSRYPPPERPAEKIIADIGNIRAECSPPQLATSSTTDELCDQDGSPISKLIREIAKYRVAAKPISHSAPADKVDDMSWGRAFGFGFLQLFDRLEPLGKLYCPVRRCRLSCCVRTLGTASRPAFCCFFMGFFCHAVLPKMPSEIREAGRLAGIEYGKCRIILHFSLLSSCNRQTLFSDGISVARHMYFYADPRQTSIIRAV